MVTMQQLDSDHEDFGAAMVAESIKSQVLHLATWQGNVPFL
jgi:hypothetical protein